MPGTVRFWLLLATIAAAPGVSHAQASLDAAAGPNSNDADRLEQADPNGSPSILGVLRDRGDLERPYAAMAAARGGDRAPTAVGYRFAPAGLVGSLGFHHYADTHPLNPDEVNRAAATQFGHPNDTVGVRVGFSFR